MAERPAWHNEVEPSLSEARQGRHGHVFFNYGGSYRGYQTVTTDCHPHGAVYRVHIGELFKDTGFVSRADEAERGKDLDMRAR